jgi:2-keto-4-pentenoate hydratase/2-oxohepta-3-ene-1,7-dioic acid hydratase in catechol pathway
LRLLSYERDGMERAAVLVDNVVYDIANCCAFFKIEPIPSGILELLEGRMQPNLEDLEARLMSHGGGKGNLPLQCWAALDEVRLLAPIPRPPKLICLGRNYRDHIEEQGAKTPEKPLLFSKASTAVIGPGRKIVIPKGSVKVDYEGELAIVLGSRIKNVDESQAAAAIYGYTILNDVTEREVQFSEKQWFRGKSMDTFAPMGPWIVTTDEIGDPLDLQLTTRVNSEIRQSESTDKLIFTPAFILSYISRTITLEPGDVISTGTPGGVGIFRDPPVFLKSGDVVEITIDRIGTLTNPVG